MEWIAAAVAGVILGYVWSFLVAKSQKQALLSKVEMLQGLLESEKRQSVETVKELNCRLDAAKEEARQTVNAMKEEEQKRVAETKLECQKQTEFALKTIEALQPIKDLIHTITADNGKNFTKYQEIAENLEISFYFCKPFHSWERGANENTSGLIRQYIPKGTDFSGITDEFVSWVENKLNNRPRKRLGYLTPNEKFNSILTN